MEALPDIAASPVISHNGTLCLQLGDEILPLRLGLNLVTAFLPGWQPVFAYTGFAPYLILQFVNESSETACWFVDNDGTRLGGSLAELDPSAREALRCSGSPGHIAIGSARPLSNRHWRWTNKRVAFLMLPEPLRCDIAQMCAASALPQPDWIVLDASPNHWDDGWPLRPLHVETLLAAPFQDRLLAAAEDGMLSWPEPSRRHHADRPRQPLLR